MALSSWLSRSKVLPKATERVTQRLHVRVVEGAADLEGSHAQRLRAEAGREGTFDFSGQPNLLPRNQPENKQE